jgi:hypothetical protein
MVETALIAHWIYDFKSAARADRAPENLFALKQNIAGVLHRRHLSTRRVEKLRALRGSA